MRTTILILIAIIPASYAWPAQQQPAMADAPPIPSTVTDYDQGDFYLVRGGQRQSYHGMRDSWVFNRAMVWLDTKSGVEDAILCYSAKSPLPLTGKKQVSRWYVGKGNEVVKTDDEFTRFVKKDPKLEWDHAALPPLQFQIEQHPRAELEVREATHPWQFFVVVKGRSGPPLYISPWQTGPGKLSVDILKLYREKGYDHHFAEMNFFLATWTKNPQDQASVTFKLQLCGDDVVVPSLPVIRTVERAKNQGVPIYAVVLDRQGKRLGKDAVDVTASLGKDPMNLAEIGDGIWKAVVRGVPAGQHKATLRAVWKSDPDKTAATTLCVRVTDGQFVSYDAKLKLMTQYGKPLGPITGSYRGQAVFKGIGTARESLLQGQEQWDAAIADKDNPDYGFHFWESLTERELEADYAHLQRCGWRMVHLCSVWLWWPRFDAAGRLSPYYAEQLAKVCEVAGRHRLHVHLALSHYPLGQCSPPYAQYLEAGYQRKDYQDSQSEYFRMFADYLTQLATIFRDETSLSSFTAAGEGDPSCVMTFVNMVNDRLTAEDHNHLFFCEPHHQITRDPNYYRKTGWKPLLGGMRTYHIEWLRPQPLESIGVQFKLSAMGHVFMGEGCFYGFLGGNHQYMNPGMPIDSYRERTRETVYTGLTYRNPIMLTWEERIVEDERIVFEQVRRAVDWSKAFQIPRLAIRLGPKLMPVKKGRARLFQYEKMLSRIPLECMYVWQDDPAPAGTLFTIDAREPFVHPSFVSDGGTLPEGLKTEMPLRLPEGFTANYSWSRDRRTLLAFLQKHGPSKPAPGIVLQNFPPDELSFQLFDLAAKKVVAQGKFQKSLTLEAPSQGQHFFLLVNDRKTGEQ